MGDQRFFDAVNICQDEGPECTAALASIDDLLEFIEVTPTEDLPVENLRVDAILRSVDPDNIRDGWEDRAGNYLNIPEDWEINIGVALLTESRLTLAVDFQLGIFVGATVTERIDALIIDVPIPPPTTTPVGPTLPGPTIPGPTCDDPDATLVGEQCLKYVNC